MDRLIHVTSWALQRLIHGRDTRYRGGAGVVACGLTIAEIMCRREYTISIMEVDARKDVPTCPKCAVLWDQALEGVYGRQDDVA